MRRLALALVVVLVALPLLVGIAGLPRHDAPDAPAHTHVGVRYLERAVAETGMKNAVTAVLLNYRGFDTFVEVVVIFTALASVLALPRGRTPGQGITAEPAGRSGDGAEVVPVSLVVSFVVRVLAPFMALFALGMLLRGHLAPGGGFQAAAVLGAVFIALGLVLGRERGARLVPHRTRHWLQGIAPLAFAVIGFVGWRLSGAFLGFPSGPGAHGTQEAMVLVLEIAIGLGGGVILARLFLSMED